MPEITENDTPNEPADQRELTAAVQEGFQAYATFRANTDALLSAAIGDRPRDEAETTNP
jgi:hypothetical protein